MVLVYGFKYTEMWQAWSVNGNFVVSMKTKILTKVFIHKFHKTLLQVIHEKAKSICNRNSWIANSNSVLYDFSIYIYNQTQNLQTTLHTHTNRKKKTVFQTSFILSWIFISSLVFICESFAYLICSSVAYKNQILESIMQFPLQLFQLQNVEILYIHPKHSLVYFRVVL